MIMFSIETAPKDGTYIILFGHSGYTTTPYRAEICHYDPEYRPLQPWVNHSNDSFLDGGDAPIGWLPLPEDIQKGNVLLTQEQLKEMLK